MEHNNFIKSLPESIQEKLQAISPELQSSVIKQLMYKAASGIVMPNQEGPDGKIPVEAERNENITTRDASTPQAQGGRLKEKSHNPVSGETTYEIEDHKDNLTHPEGGVNMMLSEGDAVNSDKTKVPTTLIIGKKDFMGKTFKEASDYLSKLEKDLTNEYKEDTQEGLTDKVSQSSFNIMMAKYAITRKQLNELQETTLDEKKKSHQLPDEKKYGGIIKKITAKKYDAGGMAKAAMEGMKQGLNTQQLIDLVEMNRDPVMPKGTPVHVEKTVRDNGLFAIKHFVEKGGMTPEQAAGVVGNLIQESQLNPLVKPNHLGTFGIAQWLGERKVNFFNWAGENKRNKWDLETQLDYILHEMAGPEKKAMKMLQGSKDVTSAVKNIRDYYERPGKSDIQKEKSKRFDYAQTIYDLAQKQGLFNQAPEQNIEYEYGGNIAQFGYNDEKKNKLSQIVQSIAVNYPNYEGRVSMDPSFLQEFNKAWIDVYGNPQTADKAKDLDIYTWQNPGYKEHNYDLNYNVNGGWRNMSESMFERAYNDLFGNAKSTKGSPPSEDIYSGAYTTGKGYDDTEQGDPTHGNHFVKGTLGLHRSQTTTQIEHYDNLNKTSQTGTEASIWDKIRTGLRDAAPYAAAFKRWNEKIIPPTLQQKPYYNPYDNIDTKFSIQAPLNALDRQILTQSADTRGNPSVRNARMAQLYANSIAAKEPLYNEQFNRENDAANKKTVGQMQYLNQWTDTNMAYRKKFENEWLQALEAKRLQQYAAEDYMTQLPILKAQEKAALAVGLSNTPYDWNPYTQNLDINKEKAALEFKLMKMKTGQSTSAGNGQVTKTDYGYIFTDNQGKQTFHTYKEKDKVTKAHGGYIKRK
jgi:polyhydroxyalkanoate synthesis regulator phasin